MSTPLESFFSAIFVINLQRRLDRWRHMQLEMEQIGVTKYERFEAVDSGPGNGNVGCCASHRAVMELIIQRQLPSAFIFEDDSTIRHRFRDNFNEEVVRPLSELPDDWRMIYLGAGYGTMPRGWFSKHLILCGQMKTTSSYGVTLEGAKELYDIIPPDTCDGIDNLYAGYNEVARCFVSEPRFFYQCESYSNLQERVMSNQDSMENPDHVNALGKYHP